MGLGSWLWGGEWLCRLTPTPTLTPPPLCGGLEAFVKGVGVGVRGGEGFSDAKRRADDRARAQGAGRNRGLHVRG